MVLRSYQREAVDAVYAHFAEEDGGALIAMPTGTGKSVVIATLIKELLGAYKGYRILVATHVKELVEQDVRHLRELGVVCGVWSAGLGRKERGAVIVGNVQSLVREDMAFDLVIIDEAHRIDERAGSLYEKLLKGHKGRVVGLTATPFRMGSGMLVDGKLFSRVVYDLCTPQKFWWLIKEGYLSNLVSKRPDTEMDLEGVRVTAGEFNLGDLGLLGGNTVLIAECLREAIRKAQGRRKILVFCVSIKMVDMVAEMLRRMGESAGGVHSQMARDSVIEDFKAGRIRWLCNANILTTGFDCPEIDCIVMLRPTMSTVLHVQMLGRGTRRAEGKEDCLVLDYAGNCRRLGCINDPALPRKKGAKGSRPAPVMECPSCHSWIHSACVVCPDCGVEIPRQLRLIAQSGEDPVVTESEVVIHKYKVNVVTYNSHRSKRGAWGLKVVYQCGMLFFTEYLMFDGGSYERKLALDWWSRAGGSGSPTTEEARSQVNSLKVPDEIEVWVNCKYPKVLNVKYRVGLLSRIFGG